MRLELMRERPFMKPHAVADISKPQSDNSSSPPECSSAPFRVLCRWGSLVKFSHSVFALPFALSMLVVIARQRTVSAWQFVWLIIAIVTARTAAMAFNRWLDAPIDALNPRTKNREIPRGVVSPRGALILIFVTSVLFLISAASLGWHCFVLAPLVLCILFAYSATKRFTAAAHVVLGLGLSLAPGGVWYALTATWSLQPVILMVGVLCWVAGFDILYSCQDEEFDRSHGLCSIPAWLGIGSAFVVAQTLHFACVGFLLWWGIEMGLGGAFYLGSGVFALLLVSQYRLVSPTDLSRIDAAFFNRNGAASVTYLLGVLCASL